MVETVVVEGGCYAVVETVVVGGGVLCCGGNCGGGGGLVCCGGNCGGGGGGCTFLFIVRSNQKMTTRSLGP